ncbi:SLC13 family permease [Thalassobaculum sp. OXR-137]|uniref:SLC13 family permease n=1 Tax=Thalassobaculum sp. OXR-137 TaxID=3100173 RepID=UPI002AC8A9DF|nr:SLC13 family permease [Thalassobaculum sp. OXR-137]WPZ34119.1 SLC13 family permease [Thalassobaculum sp. OXR-137]
MTASPRHILTTLILAALSCTLWFMPVPEGASPEIMRAAALVVLAIGAWASVLLPEHLVAVAFFLAAMILHVSTPPVIFSGFASPAFWLVFGGLIIGAAVDRTGLGGRIARTLVRRFTGGYLATVAGVVTVCLALGFLMPSTMGRLVLLLPIVLALADRLGYLAGSRGRTGLVIATGFGSYLGPVGILPANVPNNVLLGAAQTFHGIQIQYFDWMLIHFPVLGLLKSVLLVLVVWRLFDDTPVATEEKADDTPEPSYWSRDERRLALLLAVALALWATDAVHGVSPAWISLAAGLICLLPMVGLVPPQTFRDKVPINPLIYVAGILGVGALVAHSGLGEALAHVVLDNVSMDGAHPAKAFFALSLMTTLLGTVSTMPGIPAILTPIAGDLATASGLPLKTVLMTFVNGFSTVLFPYQVPPLIVLLQLGNIPASAAVRTALVTAFFTIVFLLPLNYVWWRIIGLLP